MKQMATMATIIVVMMIIWMVVGVLGGKKAEMVFMCWMSGAVIASMNRPAQHLPPRYYK